MGFPTAEFVGIEGIEGIELCFARLGSWFLVSAS